MSRPSLPQLNEYINISEFDYIVEPSAGSGSFYRLLDKGKRIGLDIDPKYDGIITISDAL